MRIRYGVLALGLLLWRFAQGAPPLTSIEDVLYKADGSKFTGVAFLEWKSFQAADTSNIATQSLTVLIQAGIIRVRLVPTTNATPGAYYRVRYHSDGRVQFSENWAVPPSSAKLRLRDVRVTAFPTGGQVQPPPTETPTSVLHWHQQLAEQFGSPQDNPVFWASISPISYVADISGPLQLHHGTADTEVPYSFSVMLNEAMKQAGKPVEFYTYPGANHNLLNKDFTDAIYRTIQFFDKYVKGIQ